MQKLLKFNRKICIVAPIVFLISTILMSISGYSAEQEVNNIAVPTSSTISPIENQSSITNTDSNVPVQIGVDDTTIPAFLIHYQEIARNSSNVLYADMENGLFAMKNLKSGKIWYSTPNDSLLDDKTRGIHRMEMKSQIIVDYIYRSDEASSGALNTENSQSSCINSQSIKVKKISDGICVTYSFPDMGFVIPVDYTLKNDYLDANIEVDKIVEGNKAYLMDINLLPTFGAGNASDNGYLFIPDGCGAIVDFNNGIQMADNYNVTVYGDELADTTDYKVLNSETINMPVYGIVTDNNALMGVITQGDGSASITEINGNDEYGYNSVSSKIIYRIMENEANSFTTRKVTKVSQVHNSTKNYEVRYYPLSGSNASYVGMAEKYREYLINEKGLTKHPEKPALNVDIYGSVDKKASFFGLPYTQQKTLTTFNQAEDILNELKKSGVNNLSVRYIGWNNSGMLNNKIPKNANPLQELGGQKGLANLNNYMKQNNYSFYPDVDLLRFRSGGNGINATNDAIRNSFNEVAYQYDYLLSVYVPKLNTTPVRLLTPKKISFVANRFLNSYKDNGVKSIGLSTIGNYYYSNLNIKDGEFRSGLEQVYQNVLKSYSDDGIKVAFDNANAYAIPYADRILNTPVYSSGYDIFTEDVPFYQIVLHGYVTMSVPSMVQSSDPNVNFLKAIETGDELLYSGIFEQSTVLSDTRFDSLYSTNYNLWKSDAVDKYKKYSSLLDQIYNKTIIDHTEVADGVFKTTYENNIQVYVNYNSHDVLVDGVKIPAIGFVQVGGK